MIRKKAMKWIYVSVLLLACNSNSNESSDKNAHPVGSDKKTIKKTEVPPVKSEIKKDVISVDVQVYYTFSYCGGAPPTEEILAEAKKRRWYQNSEIRLQLTGEEKEEISLKTDAEGKLTAEIPYGRYSVFVGKNASEQMNHLFDPGCKQITERVWKVFNADASGINSTGKNALTIIFDFPCDPCDPSIFLRP